MKYTLSLMAQLYFIPPTNSNYSHIFQGELIGGVVGTDIVRYDIYGIDPKIGNEMEAGSKEGKINVSEDTMEILKRDEKLPYYFEYNDLIKIEKLGVEKHSWYIEPIDDES